MDDVKEISGLNPSLVELPVEQNRKDRINTHQLLNILLQRERSKKESQQNSIPPQTIPHRYAGPASLGARYYAARNVLAGKPLPPYREPQAPVTPKSESEQNEKDITNLHLFCEVGPHPKLDSVFPSKLMDVATWKPEDGSRLVIHLHPIESNLMDSCLAKDKPPKTREMEGDNKKRTQEIIAMYNQASEEFSPPILDIRDLDKIQTNDIASQIVLETHKLQSQEEQKLNLFLILTSRFLINLFNSSNLDYPFSENRNKTGPTAENAVSLGIISNSSPDDYHIAYH